jgi:hypothetical protein
LRHWDRDTFLYQPPGENAEGPGGVIFRVGPGRRATAVLVESFNRDGQGTFTRVPAGGR